LLKILHNLCGIRIRSKKGFQLERLWMTLEEIQQLVARRRYQYSRKVREFIEDGFFDEEDLVHCILSATRIHKSERDELVVLGRNNPSLYTVKGRPLYVHLNGLAIVLLK
jgi:hypothetical protein